MAMEWPWNLTGFEQSYARAHTVPDGDNEFLIGEEFSKFPQRPTMARNTYPGDLSFNYGLSEIRHSALCCDCEQ